MHAMTGFLRLHRVGTGLCRPEEQQILDKLMPCPGVACSGNLRPASGRPSPRCYVTTGHADERPDWWIADPQQSIVLQVITHLVSHLVTHLPCSRDNSVLNNVSI
jgi:hypothetical protein